ncbi:MAG: YihY/virulence factor BrkB family protein [Burkholderiaceae bacterium]
MMKRIGTRLLSETRRFVAAVPGLAVLVAASRGYVRHRSGNQAGSMAFSVLLAMFPLFIVLSTAAAYIGHPGDAAALAVRLLGYAPKVVADTLKPAMEQVLRQRSEVLLAVGILVTLWTASSGVQAIRTALNNAYGVTHGLPFWKARIKVILFTLLGVICALASFGAVVVLPTIWTLLHATVTDPTEASWLHSGLRHALALIVITLCCSMMYAWLPDLRQRMRTVFPGALTGALLWVVAAAALSYSWRTVGKLALVYGGLAGLVATLIFLYVSAFTLIFGAEINAAIRERGA